MNNKEAINLCIKELSISQDKNNRLNFKFNSQNNIKNYYKNNKSFSNFNKSKNKNILIQPPKKNNKSFTTIYKWNKNLKILPNNNKKYVIFNKWLNKNLMLQKWLNKSSIKKFREINCLKILCKELKNINFKDKNKNSKKLKNMMPNIVLSHQEFPMQVDN